MKTFTSSRFHGIVSFAILDLTIVISLFAIAKTSLIHTVIYFFGSVIAGLSIILLYCTKCSCKSKCSHVLPGQLALLFKNRETLTYKPFDYLGTVIAGAFIILYPQYWLWNFKILFVAFWLLIIVAILQINQYVCTSCRNSKCAMCKNTNYLFK